MYGTTIKSLQEDFNALGLTEQLSQTSDFIIKDTPPKFKPAKSRLSDRLYVYEENLRNSATGEWQKEIYIYSPKAFIKGYMPNVGLLGEYVPSSSDLFILNKQRPFSFEREKPVSGNDLADEMEKQGFYKAFYVEKVK